MQAQFKIRKLNNTFSQQAIDLILPIQQNEFNLPITVADQPDLVDINKYYTEQGGCFWGMFDGEQLVGTISLLSIGHNCGAIRKMFVANQYRGKEFGIAAGLLQSLVSFASENDITHLYLGTITVLTAAQRFYEKNGFTRIPKGELPEWFPLMINDNIFYHRPLSYPPTLEEGKS